MSWPGPTQQSPFVFEGPLPPPDVVGRDAEIASLLGYARAGRPVSVSAPRRFGKTSLLGRVAQELREADGAAAVLVDLYGVHTFADLAVRLERAWREGVHGPLRGVVTRLFGATGLGLSLSAAGIGVALQRSPRTDPLPAVHALLDVPAQLGGGRRAWIVFDEFQELFHVDGAEALLRSHVQHHDRAAVGYAFAGSQRSLLDRMFADRDRPFYGQAEMQRLGPLPPAAVVDVVTDRFSETGRDPGDVLGELVNLAAGHPQRSMLLAHHLWRATPPGGAADAETWGRALGAAVRATSPASQARFEAMTPNQQRVVRGIAVHGTAWSARLGLTPGSAGSSLRQLTDAGDVDREAGGPPRLVDPLLTEWLRRRFGDDP